MLKVTQKEKKHLVKDPKNVKRKLHKLIVIVILAVRPFAGWLCLSVHISVWLTAHNETQTQRETDNEKEKIKRGKSLNTSKIFKIYKTKTKSSSLNRLQEKSKVVVFAGFVLRCACCQMLRRGVLSISPFSGPSVAHKFI